MLKSVCLIALFVLANCDQLVHAGSIDKAFSALKDYNYFEAKRLFEKSLKKQPAAANYGLAVIYARTDNPFHQLDSAFVCIQRAEQTYSGTKEKTKIALKKYQFDYFAIDALRKQISSDFFKIELEQPSEEGMNAYQFKHPWAQEHFRAIEMRDSIALQTAKNTNTSAAYAQFLSKYPESELRFLAKAEYNRLQYREITRDGTLVSYLNFEKVAPENPYNADAQDQIYRLSTIKNTVSDYDAFIDRFPTNRNVEQAWRKLYQLFMADYSLERLEDFQKKYPNYPFKDELKRDQELSQSVIIPYKKDGSFGWMDLSGKIVIPAEYGAVGFFKEGLAWAEKNGKYGFVNKVNETVIPFQYESATEFEKGRAIVQQGGLYGSIDRSGTFIVPAEFKDLGVFSEGLMYAQKDSLYGYYDGFGFQRIPAQYDEAFSFVNGMAKVVLNGLEGYIDPYGSFIVRPEHEDVRFISDSLLRFEDGDFYKLMTRSGTVLANYAFDEIGVLVNDRIVVTSDDKIGYLNAKGDLVIPMNFDAFTNSESESEFIGNIAKAAKSGKYGIIDRSGKVIVPFQYTKMGRAGTLIAFEKNGKWGYVDLTNKVLIPPTYENAETFSDGLGIVQQLTLLGAINPNNQVVIPIAHTTMKKLDKNHYLVSNGAKYGIYTNKGKLVVPLEYNQIRKVQDDFYLLSKGVEMHYLYLPTDTLIQPVLN